MLGLGLSLWSVALGASWAPAALFGAGQAGHWSEYNPAIGRVFQDAAGTSPATLPDQPVGLAKRLVGSVDASQAVALSRPTLARWPKGGRRNLAPSSNDMGLWALGAGAQASGSVVTASLANSAANVSSYFVAPLNEFIISGEVEALTLGAAGGAHIGIGGFNDLNNFRRVQLNLETGATSIFNPGITQVLENEVIGTNKRRFSFRFFNETFPRACSVLGEFNATTPAGRSYSLTNMSIESGGVRFPYQNVFTQNDITEAGKSDIWHLWNDGGDSLNAAAVPAGTFGLAYVDVLGGVTVTTATSDGTTPINLLRAERQAEVILRQGAFTATEEAKIRSYWGGLYV